MFCIVAPVISMVPVFIAHRLGKNQAKTDYINPPTKIQLTFKKDERELFDSQLRAANEQDILMLISQTKDLIVVCVRDKSDAPRNGVLIIARTNLLAVHVASFKRK